MPTQEWQTEDLESRQTEYPATVDLWVVEQLLDELLDRPEHPEPPGTRSAAA